jgi:Na+/citrate or Na+/malate symporter
MPISCGGIGKGLVEMSNIEAEKIAAATELTLASLVSAKQAKTVTKENNEPVADT